MGYPGLILWLGYILGGFLAGSMMFSQWIPKVFLNKDIAELSDDRNPGATNVFINCGPRWGMLCLILDVLKGFLPVCFSLHVLSIENLWFAFVLAAPVIGHAMAPINHFHGGKCIATAFGSLLGLLPFSHVVLLLAGIYIVFSTVFKINPNRIRSIVVFGLFGLSSSVILIFENNYSVAIGCVLISLTAIIKHLKLSLLLEGYHSVSSQPADGHYH